MFALLIGLGPLVTACEMVLDFDRTPLQPVFEAGADDEEDDDNGGGSSGGGSRDSGRDGTAARDTGADTGSQDAGNDAEAGQ